MFDPLDPLGVEIQQLFKGAGLRLAFSGFEVAESGFAYSRQVDNLPLGEHGAFPQGP
jgi:hypothetical protein